ncbi:MAG TPA: type II toxin-antitoxin system ParD family antitoxin [Pirellulales bacterium]|nr:type II toxin-antitoxin system ParD family antitoxin [Pirellulales bacterium]
MNISLPDSMQEFILAQMAKGGYGSVSDYIGELVRADHAQASLEAEVVRGLESGEPTPMTSGDWSELRSRIQRPEPGRRTG